MIYRNHGVLSCDASNYRRFLKARDVLMIRLQDQQYTLVMSGIFRKSQAHGHEANELEVSLNNYIFLNQDQQRYVQSIVIIFLSIKPVF